MLNEYCYALRRRAKNISLERKDPGSDRVRMKPGPMHHWYSSRRGSMGVLLSLLLLIVTSAYGAVVDAAPLPDPDIGPGGPILVIKPASPNYANFYPEVLRNEGFNEFRVADIASITPSMLAAYDMVLLAEMAVDAGQVAILSDWVNAGGNLIAMRPDAQLASLLGLAPAGATLTNGYLLVDTSASSPGHGIVAETIQFFGAADRYTLSGASEIATLYADASTATANPAITLRSVGSNGGQAAAFTYDLATSLVYARQGNPAWATQERDGSTPIRSDDKYYGAAPQDPQPDWVDLGKVEIPQADEQQRLLANLILEMNKDRKPLA